MVKRFILMLVLALVSFNPAVAQDNVLANSQGYQLRESHLVPTLQFLNFLVQDQINQQELTYLVQSSVQQFQQNPQGFLTELQTMNQSIARAQTIQDPLMLGEFRQKVIGEFYAASQQVPANQIPPLLQVLFRRMPVVAYDPNTKAALTQSDLQCAMHYLKELYQYQGQAIPDQTLIQMGNSLAQNFTQLDPKTQNFLASGGIVLTIFRTNVARMNQAQQQSLAQSYQQQQAAYSQPSTSGGSTSVAAKQWENWHNQQSFKIMQDTMNQNHVTMMNVIENMGGSDNYWTLEPTNY